MVETEIKHLRNIIRRLPAQFPEIVDSIIVKAFAIVEAAVNLVGEQLQYFGTSGGTIGV
jgi:hypothetical protein